MSFKYDDGKKVRGKHIGDKKTAKKFVGVKDASDSTAKKRKVYQNKDGSAFQKNVGKSDSKDK